MCQATVYLLRNGREEEVMREVTFLEVTDEGVRIATFFEQPRLIPGKVVSVDFLKHMVKLASPTESKN